MTPPPDPAAPADAEAMQAGPETDAAVAREVFGLEVVWTEGMPGDRVPFIGPWRYETWPGETNPRQVAEMVPEYSADIAAAWEVFMSMCDRPFSVLQHFFNELQLLANLPIGDVAAWPAVLVVLRHKMPEAISLAALRAVRPGGGSKT